MIQIILLFEEYLEFKGKNEISLEVDQVQDDVETTLKLWLNAIEQMYKTAFHPREYSYGAELSDGEKWRQIKNNVRRNYWLLASLNEKDVGKATLLKSLY